MQLRTLLCGIIATLATLFCPGLLAGELQSHSSIQTAAEQFIISKVHAGQGMLPSARAGHLDSRLRLAHCDQPLETFLPSAGRTLGNTTVGVRCSGSKTWTLYVPVKVSLFGTVVAATRPLSKGSVIQASDLNLVEADLARLRSGYFTEVSQVAGKQVARRTTIGTPITPSLVKDPRQIERGQRISLVAQTAGLEVRMKGEALEDGVAGERIQVRNVSTRRVIDGVVLSATTVRVSM